MVNVKCYHNDEADEFFSLLKKARQSIMSNTKSTCEAASKTPIKKPNGLEEAVGLQLKNKD